jgi:MFS family permease
VSARRARADGAGPRTGADLAFRDPVFGPYFWGTFLSNCGTWIHNIAAAVVMYQLTRSAFMVGLVSVLQFLPTMALSLWAGSVADRVDRRRVLLGSQLFAAANAATLAVWTLAVGVDSLPGPALVLAVSLGLGLAQAFMNPAMQAFIPSLVPRGDLGTAIGLNNSAFVLARAAGPALGALILGTAGPGLAFASNAVSFFLLSTVLFLMRHRVLTSQRQTTGGIREGLRYLRAAREPVLLIAGVASVGFAIDPVNTLTPSLAAAFGGADQLVSLMVFAFGAGAAVAIAPLPRVKRAMGYHRAAIWGLFLLGVSHLVVAAAVAVAVTLGALAVGGFGLLLSVSSTTSRLQELLPDALRGRVMAVWSIAFIGSRALAAAVNGAVADLHSTAAALMVCSLVAFTGMWWVARARPRTAGPPSRARGE